MAIRPCTCCEEFQWYDGRPVRVLVQDIEGDTQWGLDGEGIFEVLEVGCNCLVLRSREDGRRVTVACKHIVALVGAPRTGEFNNITTNG